MEPDTDGMILVQTWPGTDNLSTRWWGPDRRLTGADVAPDGSQLASVDPAPFGSGGALNPDRTVLAFTAWPTTELRIYRYPSWELLHTFPPPPGTPDLALLPDVGFDHDGGRVMMGSDHGRAQIYDTPSSLSEDEWAQWGPRDEPWRPIC